MPLRTKDDEDTSMDQSLSTWQKFKAGFSGDASAQMATKRQMVKKNQDDAELEAIQKRKAMTAPNEE